MAVKISLPTGTVETAATMLSELCLTSSKGCIYIAGNDFTDYCNYPISKGDYIAVVSNGVMVIDPNSIWVISEETLDAEDFAVVIEEVPGLSLEVILAERCKEDE